MSLSTDVTFSTVTTFSPLGEKLLVTTSKQTFSSDEHQDSEQILFSAASGVEEEIYYRDNIIIWHKGQLPVRTFHLPSKILQVVFCRFEEEFGKYDEVVVI